MAGLGDDVGQLFTALRLAPHLCLPLQFLEQQLRQVRRRRGDHEDETGTGQERLRVDRRPGRELARQRQDRDESPHQAEAAEPEPQARREHREQERQPAKPVVVRQEHHARHTTGNGVESELDDDRRDDAPFGGPTLHDEAVHVGGQQERDDHPDGEHRATIEGRTGIGLHGGDAVADAKHHPQAAQRDLERIERIAARRVTGQHDGTPRRNCRRWNALSGTPAPRPIGALARIERAETMIISSQSTERPRRR